MSYGKWKALHPPIEVEVDVPKKPQRFCRICGAEIPPEVNGNAIYCSPGCYSEAQTVKARERYQKKKKMMAGNVDLPPRLCRICGKEILPDVNGNVMYCSPECSQERHRVNRRECYHRKKERMMENGKI